MKLLKASLFLLALCLTCAVAANADTLYKNGPSTGICDIQSCEIDAWTINFGYTVTNQFKLASNSTIQDFHFAFWLFPGDVMDSVHYQLGTMPFLQDVAFGDASKTVGNLSDQYLSTNGFGYSIQLVWITGLNIPVSGGVNYWLTLSNAAVQGLSGDPVYWDENAGPSLAQEYPLGTIPSESFYVTGTTGSTIPEPSSILLVGSGILGLVGVLRRRLFLN